MSRVSPAIGVESSFPARKVIEVLEQAAQRYGWPKTLCVDNGPEFAGREMDAWAHQKGIKTALLASWQADRQRDGRELQR